MAAIKQQIRFCTSHDGVRIAYASSGQGPPLVKVANWLSHLEFDWESPVWRPLLTELSREHTLIRYDERGCGLSDWNVAELSFEAWVRDLETVVDAAGVDRFPLLGISQGASIAVAYAVRHPERVSHLILHGGYARGRLQRAATPQQREEAETMNKLAELGWGQENPAFRQFFTTQFIPGGIARAASLVQRARAHLDVAAECRALHARVQRDRRRRPAAAGHLPDARAALEPRRARAVRRGTADRRPDSRRALRAAGKRQPPAARQRAGLEALARGGARVPAAGAARRPGVRDADAARARTARADRAGPRQRADRREARPVREDRAQPHHQHLREARGRQPRAGDRAGARSRFRNASRPS